MINITTTFTGSDGVFHVIGEWGKVPLGEYEGICCSVAVKTVFSMLQPANPGLTVVHIVNPQVQDDPLATYLTELLICMTRIIPSVQYCGDPSLLLRLFT